MIEYLSPGETAFLAGLVLGQHGPQHWPDDRRQALEAKLVRLGQWAIREDEARARLRGDSK